MKTKYGNAKLQPDGYYMIKSRKEGNHGKLLHRLIFEDFYKIKLPSHISLHHIDGNKTNNEIWNLVPIENKVHVSLHNKGKILSEATKLKISLSKKRTRISDKDRLKSSKQRSTTGFYGVYKENSPYCTQGYRWRYQIKSDNGFIRASSIDLCKLKRKVLEKKGKWVVVNVDHAIKTIHGENIYSKKCENSLLKTEIGVV